MRVVDDDDGDDNDGVLIGNSGISTEAFPAIVLCTLLFVRQLAEHIAYSVL
jgi:hypothetical protein